MDELLKIISKPISVAKDIVKGGDETTGGVIRNTVKGLPKAAKDTAVDIAQSTARSFASLGLTLGAGKLTGQKEIKADDPISRAIYGKEGVQDIPTRIGSARNYLESIGLSPKTSAILAPVGVIGSTAADVYPGTAGKGKIFEKLAKETSEEAVKRILQKEFKDIAKEGVETFAKEIAQSSDVGEIKVIIDQASKIPKSSLEKLQTAIRNAAPVREEIAKEQTLARGQRAAEVADVFKQQSGESAYFKALGKLKGSLTPEKKTLGGVREAIEQTDVDALFGQIQSNDMLGVFDKITASNGLARLLEGEIPQPSQLAIMEDVFGSDLIKTILDKRGTGTKIAEAVSNVVNLPKSLITTLDASAVLRQGGILAVNYPKKAAKATAEMFRQMFSEEAFNGWLDDLYKTPQFKQMREHGLYIADPRKIAGGLAGREEQFLSNLAEKIPVFGALNRASSRAYSGFLNKMRADVFNDLTSQFKALGIDDTKNLDALANYINTATGRGNLGKLARNIDVLNATLFSPRFLKSRFDMLLNPAFYAKMPPPVRKIALQNFGRFIGAGVTVLTLAKLAGANVELNPTSTDFGKIRIGNSRWDIWGGFQQWARIIAQIATGERKTESGTQSLSGDKFGDPTRLDLAINFGRSKLSPVVSLITDFLAGKTLGGEDVTPKSVLIRNTVPIYLQDLKEAYESGGIGRLFGVAVPSFFGVGTQTYGENKGGGGKEGGLPALPSLPKLPKLPKLKELPKIE